MMTTAMLVASAIIGIGFDGSNFEVTGSVENPGTWDVARLEREFADRIRSVEYTLHDQKAKARCIPLLALVEAARPKAATPRRNPLIGFAVVASGDDGYTACLALADLLPEYGNEEVYLALDRNGEPLPDGERPVRLILPGESRPARWVFGIEAITIVDMAGVVKP